MKHRKLFRSKIAPWFVSLLLPLLMLAGCESLIPTGEEAAEPRGDGRARLGISYHLVELGGHPVARGYSIDRVIPGSAAARAGIQATDIIIAYDGQPAEKAAQERAFARYLRERKRVGDTLRLTVLRPRVHYRAQRNDEAVTLPDQQALERFLAALGPGETASAQIEKDAEVLLLRAVLQDGGGGKTGVEGDLNPWFPEYQSMHDPTAQLIRSLLAYYRLTSAWQDQLRRYASDETWDDGRRPSLFRYLHQNPLQLKPVIDDLSAGLRASAARDTSALLARMGRLAGMPPATYPPPLRQGSTPAEWFGIIQAVLDQAYATRERALSSLTAAEREFLRRHATDILDRFTASYTIDQGVAASGIRDHLRFLELARRIDFPSFYQAMDQLLRLTAPDWLRALRQALREAPPLAKAPDGVSGPVIYQGNSRAGRFIIGGLGANRYQGAFTLILDLDGDDLYLGDTGSRGAGDGLAVILDLGGNDEYNATSDFAQGAALLGVGLLLDSAGDDVYTAVRMAQGSAFLGLGLLEDRAGDDRYTGGEYQQGSALFGAGLLLDRAGDDRYQADQFAQGMGGPAAIALLCDLQGNDDYFATGRYPSSYGSDGIFRASSQGVGIGFRNYASGGFGLLLDGRGADRYRAGNFSQGVGYFFGLGLLRDFGNDDDLYTASRYGQGASAHSAIGVLVDDGGNDRYDSSFSGVIQAAAWDLSLALFWDKGGDDQHGRWPTHFAQGTAAHNGFSLFLDEGGKDHYQGLWVTGQGNDYHGGSSLGVFIDAGGMDDQYPPTSPGNDRIRNGGEHGLWIDAPWRLEAIPRRYPELL